MIEHRVSDLARMTLHSLRHFGVRTTLKRARKYIKSRHLGNADIAPDSIQGKPPEWDLSYDLLSVDETVPGRRTHRSCDYSLLIPFNHPEVNLSTPIGVFIHVFYLDIFEEILTYLKNIEFPHSLYVTTDTDDKRYKIISILKGYPEPFDVAVTQNRGRDIAPKLIAFRDAYKNHDIVLHLHTKRSPHSTGLRNWRQYLLRHLVGSPEIVKSNLHLFDDSRLGMVYPQHLPDLRGILNWGYDYDQAQLLLSRAGVSLSKDYLLEFPSSSMFWARSSALERLINLNMQFEDFPEEAGQIDGTLAHAIERTYCFFVESAGYYWLKVSVGDNYPWPSTILPYDHTDPDKAISKVYRPLIIDRVLGDGALARTLPSLRPLNTTISSSNRPRLNLFLPSLNARSVFGGAATALRVFEEIHKSLEEFDARIITLDAELEPDTIASHESYALQEDKDSNGKVLFDAFSRNIPLPIRDGDIFISTSWWSEYLRKDVSRLQDISFGNKRRRNIYLIQDYESGFSKWSSSWAIAESTYALDDGCIPIFNSEELYSFFASRYGIKDAHYIPFRVNPAISGGLRRVERTRTILIYGRPSVERNCFEILVDSLAIWQQQNPIQAAQWQIISLGEDFPSSWAFPAQNVKVRGKVSLTEYAHLLSKSSVGVSLMVSPHPSYPPLEMASAGLITVSNDYDNKIISERSGNIVGVDYLTPRSVALAVQNAVARAETETVGKLSHFVPVGDLECDGESYSPDNIARVIQS